VPHSVSVFGGAGFTGALTARLLYRHPSLELRAITARSDVGRRLDDLYPHHRVPFELEELDLGRHADVDAAVVAYPHGAAAPLVAELRERGVRVVDLSADFRLHDPAVYGRWYREHQAPALLGEAVYGLPELYREEIRGASLVANPGCYPTASLLALAPLARAGAIADVVIDAKSGVSGAGRGATEKTHFVTVDENLNAYGVPRHRHIPEIEQELAILDPAHPDVRVTFIPHLVPLDQGELVSCYVTPSEAIGDLRSLEALYADAYANEPFVELATAPPGVRDVRETNICRISVHRDERTGRVIVFGAIDNLWKGAASQAVQNLNLMLGLPEDEGIGVGRTPAREALT
jgi:N-acetyl-gamma-glutamyl-phosphate reductase